MSDKIPAPKIPAHRHQVSARSAEPSFIAGGNDDRVAAPKKARARQPKVVKAKPASAITAPAASPTDVPA